MKITCNVQQRSNEKKKKEEETKKFSCRLTLKIPRKKK